MLAECVRLVSRDEREADVDRGGTGVKRPPWALPHPRRRFIRSPIHRLTDYWSNYLTQLCSPPNPPIEIRAGGLRPPVDLRRQVVVLEKPRNMQSPLCQITAYCSLITDYYP